MVKKYLAVLLLIASPALAAVELDGDSNGATDVSKGGTNATTAAGARTALGVPATAATLVGDCTVGPCLDGSSDGGNLIKLWAGTGSYWTALQGGAPEANRSWRLPIAAAPAAGETLVMTMDQYGQMGFLPAPETSGYVLSSTDAGVLSWAAGGSGAGDDLGSAAYGDVVALWTTCTGYLKSDGTCDTPSGSATYPSVAGVANWNGSAWGTSYTVGGDAVNELVQTQSDGEGGLQLPFAIDLADITDTTGILTAKSDASCFASESAFNACFALDWPTATGEGYTNLTEFVGQTAWRLFYSNGSGDVTELPLGSSGTVLKSNGASVAPTWEADATAEGAGYVSTPPTYSDETCTAGQYALTESYRYDCVASGNWNRTALTDWSNPTPVTYSLDLTITGATGADKMTGNGVDYTASTLITGLNDSTYDLVGVPDTGRAVTCTGDVTGTTPDYLVDMSSANKAATCTFSAAESYSDVLLHWNAENSMALDKGSVTGTNTGSVFTDGIVGTYAFAKDGSYDGATFTITSAHFARAGGQIGFWFNTSNGYQSGAANRIFRIGDGGNNTLLFSVLESGIRASWTGNSTNVTVDMSAAISTDTDYFVVLKFHPGDAGNDLTLTVYNAAGDTIGSSTAATAVAMNADANDITFWNPSGDTMLGKVDNLIISNDIARDMWAVRNVTSF